MISLFERPDVEQYMMQTYEIENEYRSRFVDFVKDRLYLIDRMFKLAQMSELRAVTKYASVLLFFRYCNVKENDPNIDYLLSSLTCIAICTKRYETFYLQTDGLAKTCNGKYTAKDVLEKEIDILTSLSFDLHAVTVFDFIELYLSQFWNVMHRLGQSRDSLYVTCEKCVDMMYTQPVLFTYTNIRVLSCAVIACASAITTGSPNRSLALLTWLTHITEVDEKEIMILANKLLLVCTGSQDLQYHV